MAISRPKRMRLALSALALLALLASALVVPRMAPAAAMRQLGPQLCFAVSDQYIPESSPDYPWPHEDTLVILDRTTGDLEVVGTGAVGNTGTLGIEAIAFKPGTTTLYAANSDKIANEGRLGTLDLTTGAFTAVGDPFGSGQGRIGTVLATQVITDVDGLYFDPFSGELWGTNRTSGLGEPDQLIKIDPTTGRIVLGAFTDPLDPTNTVDFVEVQPVDGLTDVDDIAIDPSDGTMYAVVNTNGGETSLVTINRADGSTTKVADVFDTNGVRVTDIEGLAFGNDGNLYGSTGKDELGTPDNLWRIDKSTGVATLIKHFADDLPNEQLIDFEALDCAYTANASLGDYVWEDLNGDGIQNAGEPGVPDVTVNLLDCQGNPVLGANGNPVTTTTDVDGKYLFSNLEAGCYVVEFVPPPGYGVTLRDQGTDDAADSDADLTTGRSQDVNLGANDSNLTVDAGLVKLAALGDFVWDDLNGDGVQDAGEPGVSGVTVNLLDCQGNPILDGNNNPVTTTTDADGKYLFSDLQPGCYVVEFVAPAGRVFTQANQGGDTTDSDADPVTGRSHDVNLAADQIDRSVDAGLVEPASLGDFVWRDLDGDGIQDAGEPGVPGVTVNLLDCQGNPVLDGNNNPVTTTTDADGKYLFSNLTPGCYMVEFVAPSGSSFTQANQGGDEATDSDADPATGRSGPVDLSSGENNLDVDAGLVEPASLGDFVWRDLDGDGIQDAGEPGVPGVTVNLLDCQGNPILDGNGNPVTTTTDADGKYGFNDLTPGCYIVQFVEPAGFDFTLQDQGSDDTVDSDANPVSGWSAQITLIAGQHDNSIDAGLVVQATVAVGDRVWHDQNVNGQQDSGETGIAGVTVTLYNAATGEPVEVSPGVPMTATTDTSGFYLFSGLPSGDYYVVFDLTTLPAGYVPTVQDAPGVDDALDSDADRATGQTHSTGALTGGQEDRSLDLGVYRFGITLVKDVDKPDQVVGQEVTFTIQITNTGESVLVSLPMTDVFDSQFLEPVRAVPSWDTHVTDFNPPEQALVWDDLTTHFGDVNPGDGVTVLVAFRVITPTTITENIAITGGAVDDVGTPVGEAEDGAVITTTPNDVLLADFSAQRVDDGVRLAWTTILERDTWGFNLYRSTDADRSHAVKVNASTILAQGQGSNGASYAYLDEDAQPGVAYHYWLDEVGLDGVVIEVGQATVSGDGDGPAAQHRIFLPIAIR